MVAPQLHGQIQQLVHAVSSHLIEYLLAVSFLEGSTAYLAFCLPVWS